MSMTIKSVGMGLVVAAMLVGCGGTSNIGTGESAGQDPLQSADPACYGPDADPACDNPYGPFSTVMYCTNDPARPAGKNCPGFGVIEQGDTCTLMSGMCTIDCNIDADCPSAGSGTAQATCGHVVPDSPLSCVLSCDNGETCPDEMTCKQVDGGGKVCLFEMPCLEALPEESSSMGNAAPCVTGQY